MNCSKHWQASNGITNGYPRITFTGFSINANANAPRHRDQKVWQIRDDFTFSYDLRGRHDLQAGAEFVRHFEDSLNCNQCGGNIDARGTFGGAIIPSPAQLAGLVPRSVERRHLEPRGDFTVGAHLHDRHRRVPEPVPPAEIRRLGAGRLAHHAIA